jgi:hypothetical protein
VIKTTAKNIRFENIKTAIQLHAERKMRHFQERYRKVKTNEELL